MKKLLLILVLFGLIFNSCDAQRNFAAKKLLFQQVQKPYINFGYLYNWYAATDSRNIANTGWHVSTSTDFNTIVTYLGGFSIAGGKMKEIGFIYWNSPNTGATNTSKFNGRGSGTRAYNTGIFSSILNNSYYWYSNSLNTRDLLANTAFIQGSAWNAKQGMSIRLVKDATTLTDGQSSIYIGNDLKVYRTICIGTQEWLADNLAETLYRDLSTITVVTDNTAWSVLTTGARCVYNNDESYR